MKEGKSSSLELKHKRVLRSPEVMTSGMDGYRDSNNALKALLCAQLFYILAPFSEGRMAANDAIPASQPPQKDTISPMAQKMFLSLRSNLNDAEWSTRCLSRPES